MAGWPQQLTPITAGPFGSVALSAGLMVLCCELYCETSTVVLVFFYGREELRSCSRCCLPWLRRALNSVPGSSQSYLLLQLTTPISTFAVALNTVWYFNSAQIDHLSRQDRVCEAQFLMKYSLLQSQMLVGPLYFHSLWIQLLHVWCLLSPSVTSVTSVCDSSRNIQWPISLCFKARPSAKSFIWKLVLLACKWSKIYMWIKQVFMRKASHWDSLWNRGERQIGNRLFRHRFWMASLFHFLNN